MTQQQHIATTILPPTSPSTCSTGSSSCQRQNIPTDSVTFTSCPLFLYPPAPHPALMGGPPRTWRARATRACSHRGGGGELSAKFASSSIHPLLWQPALAATGGSQPRTWAPGRRLAQPSSRGARPRRWAGLRLLHVGHVIAHRPANRNARAPSSGGGGGGPLPLRGPAAGAQGVHHICNNNTR